MKDQTYVVVDSAGEEHLFVEDETNSYWPEYKDGVLTISTNTNDGGESMPIVTVAVFYAPRYMKVFWDDEALNGRP